MTLADKAMVNPAKGFLPDRPEPVGERNHGGTFAFHGEESSGKMDQTKRARTLMPKSEPTHPSIQYKPETVKIKKKLFRSGAWPEKNIQLLCLLASRRTRMFSGNFYGTILYEEMWK